MFFSFHSNPNLLLPKSNNFLLTLLINPLNFPTQISICSFLTYFLASHLFWKFTPNFTAKHFLKDEISLFLSYLQSINPAADSLYHSKYDQFYDLRLKFKEWISHLRLKTSSPSCIPNQSTLFRIILLFCFCKVSSFIRWEISSISLLFILTKVTVSVLKDLLIYSHNC